jgi:hypothetical protein
VTLLDGCPRDPSPPYRRKASRGRPRPATGTVRRATRGMPGRAERMRAWRSGDGNRPPKRRPHADWSGQGGSLRASTAERYRCRGVSMRESLTRHDWSVVAVMMVVAVNGRRRSTRRTRRVSVGLRARVRGGSR